jgi:hypothetical protein
MREFEAIVDKGLLIALEMLEGLCFFKKTIVGNFTMPL